MPDQWFFRDPRARVQILLAAGRGRYLGDHSIRFYRILERLRRCVTRVDARVDLSGDAEVGRAQKTIFSCRYLRDRHLQREINSGLNVAEIWNRANAEIFFGNARDIASNRRDEQEMSVLCLHILQAAMVYVNILM
jgi:TnpA family transposase